MDFAKAVPAGPVSVSRQDGYEPVGGSCPKNCQVKSSLRSCVQICALLQSLRSGLHSPCDPGCSAAGTRGPSRVVTTPKETVAFQAKNGTATSNRSGERGLGGGGRAAVWGVIYVYISLHGGRQHATCEPRCEFHDQYGFTECGRALTDPQYTYDTARGHGQPAQRIGIQYTWAQRVQHSTADRVHTC